MNVYTILLRPVANKPDDDRAAVEGDEEKGLPYTGIAIHAPDQRHIVDKWVANPGEKATVSVANRLRPGRTLLHSRRQ